LPVSAAKIGDRTARRRAMEKNPWREGEQTPSGDKTPNPIPPSDTAATRTAEMVSPEIRGYRMLLDFFTKEQFLDELRTLNGKLTEMRQWHDEWGQKQKDLEDEREKYRLLEAAISEVILLLDASLRVLYCTSSIESLTGYKKEEVISKRLEKLVTPASFKRFMEEFADELVGYPPDTSGSKNRTTELELHTKTGGLVEGSARIGVRRGDDREPAEIVIILSNIGDRKQSEKTLWETKEQYQVLFRGMKEAAYFISAQGVFQDVNPAWLERLGYSREEIIGAEVREIFSFPSKHPLYHHRAEGKEIREFRAKLKPKSGPEQECVIGASAWRGQNGELIGYLGVVHGMGEGSPDEKSETPKGDSGDMLLAAVVHELKKPVSAVMRGLEQVSKSVHDPTIREALERISQAATRASKVTNSVLDLYRGSPPTYEPTDAAVVNNEILLSYDEEIRTRNISVITDFATGLPRVKIDAGRLGQVISNVLANALTAMPRSGVITVKASKQTRADGKNLVRLIYADTGKGMSENELRKVFDPFFTTRGDSGGIGLGLTLSREIIERSGGSIRIESRAGEGTTVTLLLPCD
jgi:PAS domain S-box-containing protein